MCVTGLNHADPWWCCFLFLNNGNFGGLRVSITTSPLRSSGCSHSALFALSPSLHFHFLSALHCLQMAPNTTKYRRTLKSRTDNLKEREVEAGDKPSAVGHTIYLTIIAAIRSRSGPEEMAVMIDKASSWGKLHKVWVNSLFYGLRCSVPMGTLIREPMGLSNTAAQLTNSSYSQHTHCFIFRDFNYAANGNHLRPLTVYIMICVRSLIRKRLVRASRGVNRQISKASIGPNKCWCSINSAAVCWRTLWGDVTSVLIAYFHKNRLNVCVHITAIWK